MITTAVGASTSAQIPPTTCRFAGYQARALALSHSCTVRGGRPGRSAVPSRIVSRVFLVLADK